MFISFIYTVAIYPLAECKVSVLSKTVKVSKNDFVRILNEEMFSVSELFTTSYSTNNPTLVGKKPTDPSVLIVRVCPDTFTFSDHVKSRSADIEKAGSSQQIKSLIESTTADVNAAAKNISTPFLSFSPVAVQTIIAQLGQFGLNSDNILVLKTPTTSALNEIHLETLVPEMHFLLKPSSFGTLKDVVLGASTDSKVKIAAINVHNAVISTSEANAEKKILFEKIFEFIKSALEPATYIGLHNQSKIFSCIQLINEINLYGCNSTGFVQASLYGIQSVGILNPQENLLLFASEFAFVNCPVFSGKYSLNAFIAHLAAISKGDSIPSAHFKCVLEAILAANISASVESYVSSLFPVVEISATELDALVNLLKRNVLITPSDLNNDNLKDNLSIDSTGKVTITGLHYLSNVTEDMNIIREYAAFNKTEPTTDRSETAKVFFEYFASDQSLNLYLKFLLKEAKLQNSTADQKQFAQLSTSNTKGYTRKQISVILAICVVLFIGLIGIIYIIWIKIKNTGLSRKRRG